MLEPETDLQRVASDLMGRGWTTFRVDVSACEAFGRLGIASEQFFKAPPDVRRLSEWTGHDMWAGYQPMPEGDREVLDHVDRFEVTQGMIDSPETVWPWLSPEARALKVAFGEANRIARRLVAAAVQAVAQAAHRDPDTAVRLWCHDDASTLVVNRYRSIPAADRAVAVKMKPHADFGGLTLIHVGPGLDALQFRTADGWQPVAADSRDEDLGVMLTGQLFAHWLGAEAPIHQVVQEPGQPRMSTVYFNQPNLHAVIANEDGESVVAGEHISAMQAHYNSLSAPAA